MEATDTELSRWSKLVRLRDGGKCIVCGGKFDIWRLHAHHIRPKSLYPYLALRLSNGVAVCAGCHMGPVHRQNTYIDIMVDSNECGWRMFSPMFYRYVNLSEQRKFNSKNQSRI